MNGTETTGRSRAVRCALLLALLLGGCVTILKGPRANVPILGPADARFFLGDSALRPESAPCGLPMLWLLPSANPQTIRIEYGGRVEMVRLDNVQNSNPNTWYVAGNLMSSSVFGIDNDFEGRALAYVIDSVSTSRQWTLARDSSEGGRWIAVIPDQLSCAPPRPDEGVIVTGFWGETSPVVQTPLLGNHVGAGFGYRVLPELDLLITYETQGGVDLKRFQGKLSTSQGCDLTATVIAANARYVITGGLYGAGSLGWGIVRASALVKDDRPDSSLAFSDGLPVAGIGAGYAVGPIFLEYLMLFGVRRVVLAPGSTAALDFGTYRLGLLLVF